MKLNLPQIVINLKRTWKNKSAFVKYLFLLKYINKNVDTTITGNLKINTKLWNTLRNKWKSNKN